jgi:uncharacterized membrane protein YoaK (UPF0700 family)
MLEQSSSPTPASDARAQSQDLGWQERKVLLVGLSAAAGWLDSLAWVYLGKVFISFMSGNLLFLGIATGQADHDLLVRAAAALAAFLIGTAVGARITGSRLSPRVFGGLLDRTLMLEAAVLAAFAILWIAVGKPGDDKTISIVLILIGAGAMGLQASVSLAFHLPNVATVAMTATLAQLGALIGWRRREGNPILATTPGAPLMIALCLGYLISATIVATVSKSSLMALGPVVLLGAAIAMDARTRKSRT